MFEILKIPSMQRVLILGLLLRFLIMPFYFHPDIKTFNFQASFLQKGVFNIYDYLSANKDKLPLKDEFVYFPLTYFFLGGYQYVASPFLGVNFTKWLYNAQANSTTDIGVFRYLFILKLPYLVLDILIAFLLTALVSDPVVKRKIFSFWLLNPFSIALIYVYGNVDIFPVFLMVLSLFYAQRSNFIASSLTLGLGAGFKAFPILLVPFLFLKAVKKKDKIWTLFFSLGAFLLTLIPFLRSAAFRESTLVSGLTTRIISSGVNLGFGEMLMPAIIFLSILFFWDFPKPKIDLWRKYLVALVLVLISIHYHLQWFLWIMPMFTIFYSLISEERKLIIFFLIIAFTIPLLYSDSFMSVGLLRVISPFYELLPTPFLLINKLYKAEVIQGILHSILFGMGLLISAKIIYKE